MNLPRCNCNWPNWAIIIMSYFANWSRHTTYTYTVTSHNRILFLTIFICVCKVHCLWIFCTKLEDITNFNTSWNINNRLATVWTNTSFCDFCKVNVFSIRAISFHIKSCVVSINLVSSCYKIINSFKRIVKVYCNLIWNSNRSDKACC